MVFSRVLVALQLFTLICWGVWSSVVVGGAVQSSSAKRRPVAVAEVAPEPVLTPVFPANEHFDAECWKAFNEQLQTMVFAESFDGSRKTILASVAFGDCAGCDSKTWERVTKCRAFLDTSKDAGVCSSPTRKTRQFFAVELAPEVRRILVVARSQERDLFAKASSTGGFDLNEKGWIVVVVNDAPHVPTSFLALRNCIVVPSIKTLEAGASQLSVTIGGVVFSSSLFTMREGSVGRCGAVLVAKLLAGQVASALLLFKQTE